MFKRRLFDMLESVQSKLLERMFRVSLYCRVSVLVRGLSVEKLIYDSEIATQARLCMYGERTVSFVIKGREGQR